MEDKARQAFKNANLPKTPDDHIRDKDNAQLIPKPPAGAKHPPNLAPAGALGIRRNLVPKSEQKQVDPEKDKPKKIVFRSKDQKGPDRNSGFDFDR